MIYPSQSIPRGSILIDVILAILLALGFIFLMGSSKTELWRIYSSNKNTRDNLSSIGDQSFVDFGLFGNDRVVYKYDIREELPLVFTRSNNNIDKSGTPLCSYDFISQFPLGSHEENEDMGMIDPVIEPIYIPVDPLFKFTDVEVRNGIAYISVDTNVYSDPDLLAVDIRDQENAYVLDQINSGPGIQEISFSKDRIYAAVSSSVAELHVFKVNPSMKFELRHKISVPASGTSTLPRASSIFYSDGKVYLGTEKWEGNELYIFDAERELPIVLNGFEVNSKVLGIYVKNNIAYVANAGEKQLIKIDVSDQHEIFEMDFTDLSGDERQEGRSVLVYENELVLGRTAGGFNIENDHELFTFRADTGDLSLSQGSMDVSGGVYGIIADKDRIYVSTRENDHELLVMKKGSMEKRTYSLPVLPQTITCDGNDIYLLAHSAPYIYKINFH